MQMVEILIQRVIRAAAGAILFGIAITAILLYAI